MRDIELYAILGALKRNSSYGLSASEVLKESDLIMPLRTMQHRLSTLEKDGRVTMTGSRRGARYHAAAEMRMDFFRVSEEEDPYPHKAEFRPAESSRAALEYLRRPVKDRQPVGYNRELLELYRPNETYYLPSAVRKRLAEMGRSEDIGRPAGTHARRIMERLLIDLSWNSSRLEGNTYSILDTERLLKLGEEAAGQSRENTIMLLNHKEAIKMLVEDADMIGFNRRTIFSLHGLLASGLMKNESGVGQIRRVPVYIGASSYTPTHFPQVLDECLNLILSKAAAIDDPFEQSLFALAHIAYLQPFEDVNKRTSRLMANIPLVRGNLCPLAFEGIQEREYVNAILALYELNDIRLLRDVFIWTYEDSCKRHSYVRQLLGDPDMFAVRHRPQTKEIIQEVVLGRMNKKEAAAAIKRYASARIREEDRARFIELVENKLLSLHSGNVGVYRLYPPAYEAWEPIWNSD
ncbi:hypothetical protein BH09SUM1_BH09SUM1_23730 [soil metagenome]